MECYTNQTLTSPMLKKIGFPLHQLKATSKTVPEEELSWVDNALNHQHHRNIFRIGAWWYDNSLLKKSPLSYSLFYTAQWFKYLVFFMNFKCSILLLLKSSTTVTDMIFELPCLSSRVPCMISLYQSIIFTGWRSNVTYYWAFIIKSCTSLMSCNFVLQKNIYLPI